jgi:very-short-patch-repair endonuclease
VTTPAVRILAAMYWNPDAVLVGPTAASLSFWPKLAVSEVWVALSRRYRVDPVGFRLQRRRVPAELIAVRGNLRFTVPALTALDLCDFLDGDGIDTALRTRSATLAQLHEALNLTRWRSGNRRRRQLLLDSRDEPWSAAERRAHRLLRGAGITGWRANYAVWLGNQLYYLDVAFEAVKLVLEIDGRLHEDDPGVFENDRWRQNDLVRAGWRVLRFTWSMLTEHPEEVLSTVRAALVQPSSVTRVDAVAGDWSVRGRSARRLG